MGNVSSAVSSDATLTLTATATATAPSWPNQSKGRAKSGDSDGACRLFIHSLGRIAQSTPRKRAERGEGEGGESSTPPTVSVSYGKVSMLPLYCLLYISVSLVRAPEGAKQSAALSGPAVWLYVCVYECICVPCVLCLCLCVCVKSCYVLRLN